MENLGNNYDDALDSVNTEFDQTSPTPIKSDEVVDNIVKPTSLGKARDYVTRDNEEPAILPGYVELWPANFPTKGLFYAKDMRVFIRPAAVREIRHFSTMNEQDPFSIDESLNEIVKSCLMMKSPGKQVSFKDLKEEDRIFIIMAIRDLTFVNGENGLVLKPVCRECNHENELVVNNDTFERTELTEQILKYYNSETKSFDVITKSSGIIHIQPPSIGVMMETTKYIKRISEEGKKLDQSFMKILPYMSPEWRGMTENTIKNLEVEFMTWDTKKYQIMNTLTELCRVGVKESLNMECSKCGSEVTTPVTFPGGIKSLFVISDISGELL
tara:strand:+ start:1026 stop:2009 length:984 start_codon:yes stop_codon:yes gene_type:complete